MKAKPKRKLAGHWLSALWCLAVSAPGWWLVLQDGTYVGNGSDLYSYQLPIRRAVRAALLEGVFPTWEPNILMGLPLFAGWQAGVLYPPNLVATVLPTNVWLDLSVALHLFWMALGGLALGNAWTGRSAFSFTWPAALLGAALVGSGPTWGHIYPGHVSFTQAAAWLPWIGAAALWVNNNRSPRSVIVFAATVAFQLLAGHPQVSLISAVTLAVVVLANSTKSSAPSTSSNGSKKLAMALLVGGGLLGVGLAAVQWAPAAWLAPDLNRSLSPPGTIATAFSAPPDFMWTTFAPAAFGGTTARLARFSYHETLSFLSIGAVCLALAGALGKRPSSWILVGVASVLVVLSPGKHGPLLSAAAELIPPLGWFRVPSRWWQGVVCLLALAAADTADQAENTGKSRTTTAEYIVVCALALLAVALFGAAANVDAPDGWLQRAVDPRRAGTDALTAAQQHAGSWLAIAGGAAGVVAVAWRTRWRLRLGQLAAVLALTQGWAVASSHVEKHHFRSEKSLDWPDAVAKALRDQCTDQGRVAIAGRLRMANWGAAHNVASIGGYEPATPAWTNRFANRFAGRPPQRYAVNLQVHRPSAAVTRAAARVALHHRGDRRFDRRFSSWRAQPVAGTSLIIRQHPRPLARAAFPRAARTIADRQQALAVLHQLSAGEVAVDRPVRVTAGTAVVDAMVAKRTSVRLETRCDGACLLVLRDTALAGWTVDVDGKPAEQLLVDGLFRGVQLESGPHIVTWRYTAPGLAEGMALTLFAIFVCGWLWRRQTEFG